MNQNTLSQDEVDSLLQGIADDGTSEAGQSAAPSPDAAVRECDLTRQARVVAPEMPGLETIHQRFVRELQRGLRDYSQKSADVTGSPVTVQTYGELVESIGAPTNANVVALRPFGGHGLVVFEPALICGLVDALFGGSGRYPAKLEERSFSATEQRIIVRLVEVVSVAYAKAWSAVDRFELVYQRSEMQPQFVNLVRAGDPVVVSSYRVACAGAEGALHLCFPYAALEPVRNALYTAARGDAAQPANDWSERLAQEIQFAEVDLIAELAQTSASVAQLLSLKPGDFMEVEISRSIRAVIDGVPIFRCHYGTSNGKNAIKVDQLIASPFPGWPGASHV